MIATIRYDINVLINTAKNTYPLIDIIEITSERSKVKKTLFSLQSLFVLADHSSVLADNHNITIYYDIKHNKTNIFKFNLIINNDKIESISEHKYFNFLVYYQNELLINTFITRLFNLIEYINSVYDTIRSYFTIIKPILYADKLYFSQKTYVCITYNSIELYDDDQIIKSNNIDDIIDHPILSKYKKYILERFFCKKT